MNNNNYIILIICIFYSTVITDIISLVYLKYEGYLSEYGIFIFFFLFERFFVVIHKLYRLFTQQEKSEDECHTCGTVISSVIFLDFFLVGSELLNNPQKSSTYFKFLINIRAIWVALIGQFINIHAIFSLNNPNPAYIINIICQMLLFTISNLEYYYELDVALVEGEPNPKKEVFYISLLIFCENFIKNTFWGFFIALTAPKGVWAILIIEFIGGFFIEMGYQWNDSSTDEEKEAKLKEKELRIKQKNNKKKEAAELKKKEAKELKKKQANNANDINNKVNKDEQQIKNNNNNSKKEKDEVPGKVKMCLALFGPSIELFKKLLIPILVGFQIAFYGRLQEDIMIKEFDEEEKEIFKKGNLTLYVRYFEFLILAIISIAQYADNYQLPGYFFIGIIIFSIHFIWFTAYIFRKFRKNPIQFSFREQPIAKTENQAIQNDKLPDGKQKQEDLNKKKKNNNQNDENLEDNNNEQDINKNNIKKKEKDQIQGKQKLYIDNDEEEGDSASKQKKKQFKEGDEDEDQNRQSNSKQQKNSNNTKLKQQDNEEEEKKDNETQQVDPNQQQNKKKGGFMDSLKNNFDKAKTFVNKKVDDFKLNYDKYKQKNQNPNDNNQNPNKVNENNNNNEDDEEQLPQKNSIQQSKQQKLQSSNKKQ